MQAAVQEKRAAVEARESQVPALWGGDTKEMATSCFREESFWEKQREGVFVIHVDIQTQEKQLRALQLEHDRALALEDARLHDQLQADAAVAMAPITYVGTVCSRPTARRGGP